jgi:hypothetical protein
VNGGSEDPIPVLTATTIINWFAGQEREPGEYSPIVFVLFYFPKHLSLAQAPSWATARM